jgi:branched-subunit amino acid transport protein
VIRGIRWLANLALSIGVILGEKILKAYRKWRSEKVVEESAELKKDRESFDEDKDAFEEEKAEYEKTKKDIERRLQETEELEKRNTIERDKLHLEQNEFQENKEHFERDMKEVRSNLDGEIKHLEEWDEKLQAKENDLINRENALKKGNGKSLPEIAEPEIHSPDNNIDTAPQQKRIMKGPGKPLSLSEAWNNFYDAGKSYVVPKALKALEIGMIALAIRDMYIQISELEDNDPKLPQKMAGIVAGVTTRVSVSVLYGTAVGMAAGYITSLWATPAVGSIVSFIVGFGVAWFEDKYAGKTQEDFIRFLIENYPFKHKKTELEFKQDQLSQIAEEYSHASNEQLKDNLIKRSEQIIKDIEYLTKKAQERKDQEDTEFALRNLTHSISYDPDMSISKLIYEANKISFVSGNGVRSGMNNNGLIPASLSFGGSDYIPGKQETGNAQRVIDFFVSKGFSKEQAAGIAGNISVESDFNTGSTYNDIHGDVAYGLAQWEGSRVKDFLNWYNANHSDKINDIRQASFNDQLEFINWEMNNNPRYYKNALVPLKNAKTAEEAADIFNKGYEESSATLGMGDKRIKRATAFNKQNSSGVSLNNQSTNIIIDNSKKPQVTVPVPAQKTAPTIPYTPAAMLSGSNNNYGAPLSERLERV